MDFKDFTAGPNDNDRRLDKIIRKFAEELSLSEIYKAIRKGLIKLNHKKCKPESHVLEGDVISIAAVLLNPSNNPVTDKKETETSGNKLDIVFENEHILIINKPYDISVHGSHNSLDKQVLDYYKQKKDDSSLSFTPGPLHRVDRKTTGLVAFSLSLPGAHWFSENIQNHSIKKIYYALLEGELKESQYWEDMITNNDNDNRKGYHTVKASKEIINDASKTAKTYVNIIAKGSYKNKKVTFVEFQIITGRKHQLRAQSALNNHPLLGDTAYGASKIVFKKQEYYLQASKLLIPDNPINLPEKIEIPLSSEFIDVLKYCGIEKIGV